MFTEIFAHFAIIILPLLLYQTWAFKQAFNRLPYATPIIGLYGGLFAILSEMWPVHVLGLAFDFKIIPLTLSFLYGNRYAGMLSLVISMAYRYHAGHAGAFLAILSMTAYSLPSFLISKRFPSYSSVWRVLASVGLSAIGTIVQTVFVYMYFATEVPGRAWASLHPYLHSLIPGLLIQITMMLPAAMVIDHVIETGKVRLRLLQQQKSLKESEERYRSLVEYNPDGVCAVDKQGRFIFANHMFEQMTGYTTAELGTVDNSVFWFDHDENFARSLMQRALSGEVLTNVERNLRHKDGSRLPVRVTLLPLKVSEETIGFCVIAADLRAVEAAENMLRNADKLATVGELAAGIAHEIRNPLTSIKGFLKLLRSSDRTTARYVNVMETEIDRLHLVSNQLLSLAKPQVDNRVLCDVEILVKDVKNIMQPQALLMGVELIITSAASNAYIVADEGQIKQVIINLIKNALEATQAGGKITVCLVNASEYLKIMVQDTGVGISPEVLPRLGEPFYSTKTKGNGLGLMVTHRIVQQHGGHIEYDSRVNEGTTVTVHLPSSTASPHDEFERRESV